MTALTTGPRMPDGTPNNVIQMRRRADLAGRARDEIATARRLLDQTEEEFADTLAEHLTWDPTPAAVRGWETNAVPPGDVLLAAQMLTRGDAAAGIGSVGGDPDIVHAYATRRHIARPEWQGMIRGCSEHIWLDGMAEQGYANDDDVPDILEQAATDGCDIRILLLDPDYPNITDIDADEGSPAGTLAARIRGSLHRFDRMTAKCGGRMQVRTYSAPPSLSIVRGDQRMLVTPYTRFFTGGDSPTFLLEATPGGEMFARFERHFHRLWDQAKERTAA